MMTWLLLEDSTVDEPYLFSFSHKWACMFRNKFLRALVLSKSKHSLSFPPAYNVNPGQNVRSSYQRTLRKKWSVAWDQKIRIWSARNPVASFLFFVPVSAGLVSKAVWIQELCTRHKKKELGGKACLCGSRSRKEGPPFRADRRREIFFLSFPSGPAPR